MYEPRRAFDAAPKHDGRDRALKPDLVVFCGLLLTVSAFSCDITLPAFWAMERDLGASIEWVQAMVPVFLFAAACGQIVCGPVSDRFGRKPVIVAGLALYLLGTVIALIAENILTVQFGRIAQGLGSGASVAVGRAVLRDVSHGKALAQAMAWAMAIFALGPITAPLLGFGLVALAGWRAIFFGMALFAALLLVLAVAWFQETNREPDPTALSSERLSAAVGRILRERQSWYFLLLAALTQFLIVSFVANAPRFFKSAFAIDGLEFAVFFAATGLGIILGQVVNSRLIGRFGVLAATRLAAWILFAVTLLIVLSASAGALPGALFAGLMFLFNTSFLVVIANAASLVIDPHRDIAGFASSAYGAFTQLTSSLLAVLTIPVFAGSLLAWAVTMLAVTGAVLIGSVAYRPRAA
jgi:DHA1 family bicyclomycin/chloramphenicol resistance-like MFS transporter